MDEEEKESKFQVDDDYLLKTKRNEEGYKFLKLEEPETELDNMKLFKLENSDQIDSKYKDKIKISNEIKLIDDVKHNDIMKDKSYYKLKNEGDINGYVSNELLSICKSEKIIIDIDNDLQPTTSGNILDCSDGDFDHTQVRAWHSSESGKMKKKNVSNTKSVDKSKIYSCSRCNYRSQSRKNFVAHLLVHSAIGKRNRRKLVCAHCHYSSAKKSSIIKHLATHGCYGESVYKCTHCGTEFKHRYNLVRHLSTGHPRQEKPRPFKCPSCPTAYGTYYELNRHSLMHSRELPYKCTHCDFATARRYILQEHLSRHQRNSIKVGTRVRENSSGCRVKNCKETGRSKEEKQSVRCAGVELKPQSVQREDKYPFECAICGYRTSKHSLLKYHIVGQHTREPVFECLTCDYSTFRREDLVKHRQSKKHDIFSCEHCDYTCFKYLLIEKHMKTHFKYC